MPLKTKPLIDSSSALTDGKVLRSTLRRSGYLYLRGILDRDRISALAGEVQTRLHQEKACLLLSNERILEEGLVPCGQPCSPTDACAASIYRAVYRSVGLHTLPWEASIRSIIHSIYGEPIIHQPMVLPRIVFPAAGGAANATVLHQDYPGNQGSERALTVWCPLADYSVNCGTLAIASGRHREGVFKSGISSRGVFEIAADLEADEVSGDVLAGDLLVFTAFTPHRALPNESNRIRISVDFRYQPESDPVSALNFSDVCPAVNEPWDVLYDEIGLDRELRFFWKSRNLTYHEHSNAFFDRQLEAACRMHRDGLGGATAFLRAVAQTAVDPWVRERVARMLSQAS